MRWRVHQHRDVASNLFALDLTHSQRCVHRFEVTNRALVLGSAQQSPSDLLGATQGFDEVIRRRTGGGMVHMLPGEQLWFDLTIPTSDPLWCDDVSASFGWLGQVFVDAFADLGYRAQAHEGPSQHVDLGRICCFAGIGSGEVVIHGRKVVGLSQRRTREGARFQCLTYRRFAPQELLSALADEIDTQPLSAQLVDTVGVFGDTNLLFDTVVQHLDRLDLADPHVDDDLPASNQPVSAHSNG